MLINDAAKSQSDNLAPRIGSYEVDHFFIFVEGDVLCKQGRS